MKREDFYIGLEFCTGMGRWGCTDVGSRVIVAIQIDRVNVVEVDNQGVQHGKVVTDEASWFNGPPYAVTEHLLDEYGMGGCSVKAESFVEKNEGV